MPMDLDNHRRLGLDQPAPAEVTRYRDWDQSRIYPNTLRDLLVYLPARLDPRDPVDLLVRNDGVGYSSRNGAVRATRVLDTLHARNEVRQTLGVFVNPGRPPDAGTDRSDYHAALRQRSLEYDALTPDYGISSGGHNYPYLVRTTSKPLRIFLQSGANDAQTLFANWLWRSPGQQPGDAA